MTKLFYILLLFSTISWSQNFTYSGYIYNSVGGGIQNMEVKLYKRTTPTLNGFTSQNNYNGHSYYRSTGSMTWTDARQACLNMGGHLVTVTSPAENNFIFNLWPNGWIGLTDEVSEGTWRWVTNEPFSWSNWNGGEPNNAGNEDYIQFVGGGKWNDLPNVSLPYVLEFDYIVTYTPWTLETTVYTDATGKYTISLPTNPSIERYIEISTLTMPTLTTVDAKSPQSVILNPSTINSKKYYLGDVNNDGRINVADSYYIYARMNGKFTSWTNPLPVYRLFTSSEWTVINLGTSDYRVSYPGTQIKTITSPVNGSSTNFYLLRTGFSN
jgi:hypothetical protein